MSLKVRNGTPIAALPARRHDRAQPLGDGDVVLGAGDERAADVEVLQERICRGPEWGEVEVGDHALGVAQVELGVRYAVEDARSVVDPTELQLLHIAPSTDRAESTSLTDPSDQPVVARSAGHDPHRRFERQNSFSNANCMVYVFGRLPVIGNSQLHKKNQLSAMWNRVPGPRLNSVLRRAPPSRGTAKLVSR